MANTLLFYDKDGNRYLSYRPWGENGKGSLIIDSHNLDGLIRVINSSRSHFREPFSPKGGVPQIYFGNKNPNDYVPLSEELVQEVISALSG
ncbi:hypothetical protein J4448_06515 [Candidatus Woesearchaeota archaeon]|nr:hypothetical protein [Candidatus Woesearchaeota archaeon]